MTFDRDEASRMAESQSETTSDTGIEAKLSGSLPTLGEKLAFETQRIANRRTPHFPWLRMLQPIRERVVSLPVPSQARFERTEASRPGLPSLIASYETLREALYPLSQQSFVHPASSVLERIAKGSGQEWGQPLPPLVQQRLQSFSSDDMQANPMPTEPHYAGGIQQEEWGQPLPPLVQQRLRDFVGSGTETIRVHHDEVADAIVRPQRADAVTIGHHVFFRKGHFQPQEREGFALLAHEATHVIQAMRPDSAWKRATQMGVHEEEELASIRERKAFDAGRDSSFFRQPATLTRRPAVASRSPATPVPSQLGSGPTVSPSPVLRPLAATTERAVDKETAPMPDVDELKRAVYRDLMKQIRADLERGG